MSIAQGSALAIAFFWSLTLYWSPKRLIFVLPSLAGIAMFILAAVLDSWIPTVLVFIVSGLSGPYLAKRIREGE